MKSMMTTFFLFTFFFINNLAIAQPYLSENEIADTLLEAHEINITVSQKVQSRADTPAVRSFAERMVEDNTVALQTIKEKFTEKKVTPEQSLMKQELQNESLAVLNKLKKLDGEEYARTYLKYEIEFHKEFLNYINQKVMPQAKSEYLKNIVQNIKTRFSDHLKNAQDLSSRYQ
jgi:putative membrane protein